jgi:hypothetical protein
VFCNFRILAPKAYPSRRQRHTLNIQEDFGAFMKSVFAFGILQRSALLVGIAISVVKHINKHLHFITTLPNSYEQSSIEAYPDL